MTSDGYHTTDPELLLDIYERLIALHGFIVDSVRIQQLDGPAQTKAVEEFANEVRASLQAVAASFHKFAEEVRRDGK